MRPARNRRPVAARHAALARSAIPPYAPRIDGPPRLKFLSRRRAAWLSHAPLEVGKPAVLTPNLVKRRFSPTKGNAAWATNITDFRTWQGWLYLAVVIDLFSGKVVGWDAGPTIHHEHDSLATPPTTNPEEPRLLSRRPPRCACAAGDRPLHLYTKPVQPSCDCHPDRRRGPAVSRAQPHG